MKAQKPVYKKHWKDELKENKRLISKEERRLAKQIIKMKPEEE